MEGRWQSAEEDEVEEEEGESARTTIENRGLICLHQSTDIVRSGGNASPSAKCAGRRIGGLEPVRISWQDNTAEHALEQSSGKSSRQTRDMDIKETDRQTDRQR